MSVRRLHHFWGHQRPPERAQEQASPSAGAAGDGARGAGSGRPQACSPGWTEAAGRSSGRGAERAAGRTQSRPGPGGLREVCPSWAWEPQGLPSLVSGRNDSWPLAPTPTPVAQAHRARPTQPPQAPAHCPTVQQ